jgi:glycerophosphoryl diester phosphodiesterase
MSETMHDGPHHPLIIAQRGASADAPEHTIAAFELALAHGADGLDLDVHLSRDAQPVVIHDFTLERTTDGAGPVNQYSVRELKRLDVGGWRGGAFRGQRIQTLQEVFERFRGRTRFWVTLRGGADLYPGIAERVASTVESYGVLEQSLVQCLDHRSFDQIRVLNSELGLGAVLMQPPLDPPGYLIAGLRAVSADASLLARQSVVAFREVGLDCYVWTCDEPAQVDRLVEWGVSGLITARPGQLSARLTRQPPSGALPPRSGS